MSRSLPLRVFSERVETLLFAQRRRLRNGENFFLLRLLVRSHLFPHPIELKERYFVP